jgi:ABC-type uncharacterized transport system ATPase subunit
VRFLGYKAVVVVEHDMEFIRSIAKKVTVLDEGSVLAEVQWILFRIIKNLKLASLC